MRRLGLKMVEIQNQMFGLETNLKMVESNLQTFQDHSTTLDRKILMLKEHQKQTLQTIGYNEVLQSAVKQEIDSEVSLMKIINSERNYISSNMKGNKLKTEELNKQISSTQRYLSSKKKQLEDLEATLKWETSICQTWLRTSISHEENTLQIMNMKSKDASTIKNLEHKMHEVNINTQKWNKLVEKSTNEQHLLLVAIKRASQDFSSHLLERDELVNLWEQCIQEMEKQDKNIVLLGKELEKTLNEVLEVKGQLVILEQQMDEDKNKETKLQQTLFDINAALPSLQQSANNFGTNSELEKQLESLKIQVRNDSLDESSSRLKIKMLQKQAENKKSELVILEKECSKLEVKLKLTSKETTSTEQRLRTSEAMSHHETSYGEKLDQEINRLQTECSKRALDLKKIKIERKIRSNQILSQQTLCRTLDAKLIEMRKKVHQQENEIQDMISRECDLRQRLSWMKGTSSHLQLEVEQKQLVQLKSLQETELEKSQHLQAMESDLYKTQKGIDKTIKALDSSKVRRRKLQEQITTLQSKMELLSCNMKKLKKTKENSLVDESLLQVEVRRLLLLLGKTTNTISEMCQKQNELKTAAQGRLQWVEEYGKVLQSKRVTLNDKRQSLKMSIEKTSKKTESLKLRHASLCLTIESGNESETNSNFKQEIIKKVDKERSSLVDKNTKLTDLITKTDLELDSATNSLDLLEETNRKIREDKKPFSVNEKKLVKDLESTLDKLHCKMYDIQKKAKEKKKDISSILSQIGKLRSSNVDEQKGLEELEISSLHSILSVQEEQLSRESDKLTKMERKIRKDGDFPEKADIWLRELNELQRLAKLIVKEG